MQCKILKNTVSKTESRGQQLIVDVLKGKVAKLQGKSQIANITIWKIIMLKSEINENTPPWIPSSQISL